GLVLTLAAQATGDPCFGLKYGSTATFANALGYLTASAPDLRTALRSLIHYQQVVSSNVASLSEPSGAARIEWTYPVTMGNVAQLTDFVLMRFLLRIQTAAGPSWRPLSVGVTHHARNMRGGSAVGSPSIRFATPSSLPAPRSICRCRTPIP